MKIPKITGIIDRRILVNFTADADIAKKNSATALYSQAC
ncbi:hypothetical protein ABID99_001360 [Mucilaginibacter sp. OAE612]